MNQRSKSDSAQVGKKRSRPIHNPWPRLCLASVLAVWAGANIWSTIFRWNDIMADDVPNRTLGLLFSLLFSVMPMVVAIFLFWTIVVDPEDHSANQQKNDEKARPRNSKKKNKAGNKGGSGKRRRK